MELYVNVCVNSVLKLLLLLSCTTNCIYGRRAEYPEETYQVGYEDIQQNGYDKIKIALQKLENKPEWDSTWPDPQVKLGQVSGVAIDNNGLVYVFHRANHVWDERTFTDRNIYMAIGDPPIQHPTIMIFNDTGALVDQWGDDFFYMPHGITVDKLGNVWVTDVAMHQVFKFKYGDKKKPTIVLGEKFVPNEDDTHFCKPSAVAVASSGDFFVADGYCNSRIIKFSPSGERILQWGRRYGDSPFTLSVPHALTLAEEHGVVCVANRERGRVNCYRADNGTYVSTYSSWLWGSRVFSVAYSPVDGGRLYVVNGPSMSGGAVRGWWVSLEGRLRGTFAPRAGLANPHDVAVSADGQRVYVAELNPYRVYKFVDDTFNGTSRPRARANLTAPAKPTATVGK